MYVVLLHPRGSFIFVGKAQQRSISGCGGGGGGGGGAWVPPAFREGGGGGGKESAVCFQPIQPAGGGCPRFRPIRVLSAFSQFSQWWMHMYVNFYYREGGGGGHHSVPKKGAMAPWKRPWKYICMNIWWGGGGGGGGLFLRQ